MFIILIPHFTTSIHLECNYFVDDFTPLGSIYTCLVINPINITSPEETLVTSVNGTHVSNKTNDDVLGVYILSKMVHYFPQGLEIFFKNIIGIIVGDTELKQITQQDFRNYQNLKLLALYDNSIEVLEEGLFDITLDLIFINLESNVIATVHPEVFDNLTNLTSLMLSFNICIDRSVYNNPLLVQELIQQVRMQCPSPGSTTTIITTTGTSTTPAPEDNECPESCLSRIVELEKRLNNFINETTVRLDRIESILNGKIGNLEKNLEKVLKTLDIKV